MPSSADEVADAEEALANEQRGHPSECHVRIDSRRTPPGQLSIRLRGFNGNSPLDRWPASAFGTACKVGDVWVGDASEL
jgi:hypothetical protein